LPGAIAGSTVLAVVIAAFVGMSFHLKSAKSQKKVDASSFRNKLQTH
jgi:hypothetical protein